jgi:uncharacterized RDD family membrane protein YckC
MTWYYANGDQQTGPITDAELAQLVNARTITTETLVWHEGMTEWQPYGRVQTGGANTAVGGGVVCSECGNVFPPDEVIQHGEVFVCAACKPVFVQKLKEGGTLAGILEYAGFWIRFGAQFLDRIILNVFGSIVGFAAGLAFASAARSTHRFAGFAILQVGLMLFSLLLAAAYETFFVAKYGATPGKMACKLRVVTAEGDQLDYKRALGRHFAKYLSALTLGIGFIMIGTDKEEHRGLHDRICNTRVVKR